MPVSAAFDQSFGMASTIGLSCCGGTDAQLLRNHDSPNMRHTISTLRASVSFTSMRKVIWRGLNALSGNLFRK
jgi:hypothetical protein